MLPNAPIKSRNTWISDLVTLAILLLVFYTLWLGSYPLFTPDEGRYSEIAREMVVTGDYITPRVNGVVFLDKPILYYWLQAAAIHLFGLKEWALRLFPALFGVLGCLVTYIAGRQLFDRLTGILSAIILATSPLYFGASHYANLDLEVAVLISSSLIFFIIGVKECENKRSIFLISAYIAAALAFLTKGLIGLAFPAMIAGAWILMTWRWNLLLKIHLIKGFLLAVIIIAPWYILAQRANPEFLHYFFVTQQVTRFLSKAEFNNPTPLWFYAPIVLLGFFPWSSFALQAIGSSIKFAWRERVKNQYELYLLLWIAIIFIFFSIPRSKTVTYILPIFPALALITGHYIAASWENARQKNILTGILFFAIACIGLASAFFIMGYYHLFNLSSYFKPYLYTFALLLTVSAVIAIAICKKETLQNAFILMTATSTIFLLTLTMGAIHLNTNTAKPLIASLKRILKPEDEVINYFKFYQDIPLYLQRNVVIVANWDSPAIIENDNWVRELWYGKLFQNTDSILINEDTFWQRFESDKRVFVFLNENYLDQFKLRVKNYYLLDTYRDILLVSNKPAILTTKIDGI